MRKTPAHMDGHATEKLLAFAPEFSSFMEEIVIETGHWVRIGAVEPYEAFDYMERLNDASAAHPMSMGIQVNGRTDENNNFVLINTWGHLEDFPNPYRPTQNNFYRPVFQTYQLSPDEFIYEASRLPIRIDGHHTALKFISRTGILDIQEKEFQQAMIAGLVMAQSFNVAAGNAVRSPQPIIIPHPKGAFLGNIVPVGEKTYSRIRMEMRRDENLDAVEDLEDSSSDDYFTKHWKTGYANTLYQPVKPAGFINMRTYFKNSMFYPEQRRSVERLRNIFNDPAFKTGIDFAVGTHLTSEYAHRDNMDHFGCAIKLYETIQDVMATRDWAYMSAESIRRGHLLDTGPEGP